MKYYVLKFEQDFADEFDVVALQCFTEEEFKKWITSSKGTLDPEYASKLDMYNIHQKKWDKLDKVIEKELGKSWGSIPLTEWPKKLLRKYEDLGSRWDIKRPVKGESNLTAYLGNYGEYFEEGYHDYLTGEDFVKANIVEVNEVSKEFYDTFKKCNLEIALCNIFDFE